LENSRSILARIGEFDIKTRELGTDMQPMLLEQLVGIIMKRKGTPPKPLTTLSFSTDVRF
jgi:hypothetical protein